MRTAENNATTKQRRDQQKWAVVGGDDGDTTASVMDSNGRCDGNAMAMTAMQRGGDGGSTPTSDGRHRGESVHLELLSSLGTSMVTPPTAHGRASPTPAPSRPWTCVISTARRGTCRSSMAYRTMATSKATMRGGDDEDEGKGGRRGTQSDEATRG